MSSISLDKQMRREFRHTQTTTVPLGSTGVVALLEEPGMTGLYHKTAEGLRPIRTVDQSDPAYHKRVLKSWNVDTSGLVDEDGWRPHP